MWLAAAVFTVCLGTPAAAAEDRITISGVSIGYEGWLKVGRWVPVSFQVDAPPDTVIQPSVIAPDPDGSEVAWQLPPLTTGPSGSATVTGTFRLGRIGGVIRVVAGDAVVAITVNPNSEPGESTCVARRQDVAFVGVVGSAPGFVRVFGPRDSDAGGARSADSRLFEFRTPEDLPWSVDAYDALDVVVMAGEFAVDAARSAALDQWVQRGGHLVLAPGSDPQPFSESALSAWVPMKVRGIAQFRELAALVDRVPGGPTMAAMRGIAGVRIEPGDGLVLAGSLDGPLAVRCAHGLGRVTMLAIDWTREPLKSWPGLTALCVYLADLDQPRHRDESGRGMQLRPTGVSELATQLQAQLDSFPGVHRPSYWTVISCAAAFLLLVGPLDYLLVHRVLKKPRATWFTFPLWIAFAAMAASVGAARFNAPERQANQLDLVDVDARSGRIAVQTWATVYSPASHRFEVEAAAADWLAGSAVERQALLTWTAPPESGFGGMYRSGGLNLANPPYAIDAASGAVPNLPIGQWSSKSLAATWESGAADSAHRIVESDLADDGSGLLLGSLTHHLPAEITDWCLAYGGNVYFPRSAPATGRAAAIRPGLAWSPEGNVRRRQLKSFLQGQTYTFFSGEKRTGDSATLSREEYDPLEVDPLRWARTLTFHRAAGGFEYTGLTNSSLERCDLSRLLPLKRAILFGRIQPAAAEFAIDGARVAPQQQLTFVRLALPVRPVGTR